MFKPISDNDDIPFLIFDSVEEGKEYFEKFFPETKVYFSELTGEEFSLEELDRFYRYYKKIMVKNDLKNKGVDPLFLNMITARAIQNLEDDFENHLNDYNDTLQETIDSFEDEVVIKGTIHF